MRYLAILFTFTLLTASAQAESVTFEQEFTGKKRLESLEEKQIAAQNITYLRNNKSRVSVIDTGLVFMAENYEPASGNTTPGNFTAEKITHLQPAK